jgi:hypothetical protein
MKRRYLVVLVLAAGCSQGGPSVPSALVDPLAYRAEGEGFAARHASYSVQVARTGSWSLAPVHHPAGGAAMRGAPIEVNTAHLGRSDGRAATDRTVRVEGDGRLAIDHGVAVERLKNVPEGVEQSWTFAAAPDGKADLEVRLSVAGQVFAGENGAGLHFVDPATRVGVRYGLATWVDASGKRTALTPRWEHGQIAIVVPAAVVAGSRFPAVLDPTLSPEFVADKPAATNEINPSVATDGVDFLVVWQDDRNLATSNQDIYATIFDGAAKPVLASFPIITANGAQTEPTVTYDGKSYLVSYIDGNAAVRAVRVSRIGSVGTPFIVDTLAAGGDHPRAAASNGENLIVYQKFNSGSGFKEVWGTRVAQGASAADGVPFLIDAGTQDRYLPVAGASGSDFMVSWVDNRDSPFEDVYAREVPLTSGALGPELLVRGGAHGPGVTSDGTNYFIGFGEHDGGGFNLNFAVYHKTDSVLVRGSSQLRSAGDFGVPIMSPSWDGSHFIYTYRFGNSSIELLPVAPDYSAPISPTDIVLAQVATSADPQTASDGKGKTLIAYAFFDGTTLTNRIRARMYNDDLADGDLCTADADCLNANCVAGICCHTACDDSNGCTFDCGTGTCQHVNTSACGTPFCLLGGGCAATWQDSDTDGLNDQWETNQYIDMNCNGMQDTGDIDLTGAVVGKKDVFVQYDFMQATTTSGIGTPPHCHQPSQAVLDQVAQAFTQAGFALHWVTPTGYVKGDVNCTSGAIPEHLVTTRDPKPTAACAGPDFVTTHQLREAAFGSTSFGLGPHLKHPAYHYLVFAHSATLPDTAVDGSACPADPECGAHPDPTSSGSSDVYGDDIIVAMGYNVDLAIPVGIETLAGTTLHELGHNLGLKHGSLGAAAPQTCLLNKPNFVSVMDYSYQSGISVGTAPGSKTVLTCTKDTDCTEGPCATPGTCHCTDDQAPNTCYRIDYSATPLLSLDETKLDENVGVGGPSGDQDVIIFCTVGSGCAVPAPSFGPINWNGNSVSTDTGLNLPICGVPGQLLVTATDWDKLNFPFQCSPAWGAGAPEDDPTVGNNESGLATAIANHNAYPPFSVSIDIRPGCGANWVVAGGSGNLPVAVLGSAIFAVSSVDATSLRINDVPATSSSTSDVNGDGFLDLVANFPMASLPITGATTQLTLIGAQTNSRSFAGTDSVTVVSGSGPVLAIKDDGTGYSATIQNALDHSFVTYSLADCVTSATDRCGGALSINSIGNIVRITSDETDGGDHGKSSHGGSDMLINSSSSFSVRRERDGGGNGRVYTVIFTATDSDGVTQSQCKIQVEHDPGSIAVDSGVASCVGSGC